MLVELHIIQNFAPSNLNRSDTGSPKDCVFGDHRRARISSQCFKRAIRETFKNGSLFSEAQKASLARRTRLLVDEIVRKLIEQGKGESQSRRAVEVALNAAELEIKENGQTEYLVFIGQAEINAIAGLCLELWDTLMKVDAAYEESRNIQAAIKATEEAAKGGAKEVKQKARARVKELKEQLKNAQETARKGIPKELKDAMLKVLDGGKAADLALFGRMLANLPEKNVDAACQVAHAISTHKSGVEFDFYTAVDDLLPHGETGAGMMGTVEFNSACFYRYANIDLNQLKDNLGGDEELTQATLKAFIRASIEAVPTSKQNSTAAQNPPSFVMAVVRESGLWSLANAFESPVRSNQDGSLVENSIKALDKYWGELSAMYGTGGIKEAWVASLAPNGLTNLENRRVKPENGKALIDRLIEEVQQAASNGQA